MELWESLLGELEGGGQEEGQSMIPGMGAMPSMTGGGSSASNGDTSTNSTFRDNGLNYNRGNGVPGWVIGAAAVTAFLGFIYMNKNSGK